MRILNFFGRFYNFQFEIKVYKDDNIPESEALVGQTNINTCGVSELNKKNINQNKIVSKFVAKLLKYKIMFKEYLHF